MSTLNDLQVQIDSLCESVDKSVAMYQRARKRIAELEEALRPFAEVAKQKRDDFAPERPYWTATCYVDYHDAENAETVLNGGHWQNKERP